MKRNRTEYWRNYYLRNQAHIKAVQKAYYDRLKEDGVTESPDYLLAQALHQQARYARHREAILFSRKMEISVPEARRLIAEMDAKKKVEKNGNASKDRRLHPPEHTETVPS